MEDSTSLIKSVELLVEEVGKLLLRCGIMVGKLCKEAKEVLMRILFDENQSDKGGEDMECGGKITDGVCDCHTHNCCPAVDGRSKVNPECPHLEWVGEYKIFYARVMGKNTLEDCNI